jgi:hypothetical protein
MKQCKYVYLFFADFKVAADLANTFTQRKVMAPNDYKEEIMIRFSLLL